MDLPLDAVQSDADSPHADRAVLQTCLGGEQGCNLGVSGMKSCPPSSRSLLDRIRRRGRARPSPAALPIMHIDHVPRLGRGPPRGLIHAARGILVSQPDQRPIGFKGVAVARSEVSTGVNVDQCRPMAVNSGAHR
jgi:hypothetical protein